MHTYMFLFVSKFDEQEKHKLHICQFMGFVANCWDLYGPRLSTNRACLCPIVLRRYSPRLEFGISQEGGARKFFSLLSTQEQVSLCCFRKVFFYPKIYVIKSSVCLFSLKCKNTIQSSSFEVMYLLSYPYVLDF